MPSREATILYVIIGRGVGGLERRFSFLYKALSAQNSEKYQATFIISRAQYDLFQNYRTKHFNPNIHLIRLGLPYIALKKTSPLHFIFRLIDYLHLSLFLLVNRPKFNVVHFVTGSSLLFKLLVNGQIKVFSFVHSYTPDKHLKSKQFKSALKNNFRIDCLSDDLKKQAVKSYPNYKDQIFAAPCSFIDYSKTSVGPKKKVITFLSRLHEGKGLDILLPALPTICEYHPDFEVRLLGHGFMEAEVSRFITQNKLWGNVKTGFSQEPSEDLKDSLIFLSLQERENYPSQSLIEAMACGNAIVATDVGLTRKLVNEEVGILIQNDTQQLVDAIDYLSADIERTKRMGYKGREKVLKEHRVEKFINYLFTEVYQT